MQFNCQIIRSAPQTSGICHWRSLEPAVRFSTYSSVSLGGDFHNSQVRRRILTARAALQGRVTDKREWVLRASSPTHKYLTSTPTSSIKSNTHFKYQVKHTLQVSSPRHTMLKSSWVRVHPHPPRPVTPGFLFITRFIATTNGHCKTRQATLQNMRVP